MASPLGTKAHSNRSVASSKMIKLEVCSAAVWSFPQALKSLWVNPFSGPQGLCICMCVNLVGQTFVQSGYM